MGLPQPAWRGGRSGSRSSAEPREHVVAVSQHLPLGLAGGGAGLHGACWRRVPLLLDGESDQLLHPRRRKQGGVSTGPSAEFAPSARPGASTPESHIFVPTGSPTPYTQAFSDLGNLHDFPKRPPPSENTFGACRQVPHASRYFLLEGGNDKPRRLTMTGFLTPCNSPGSTDARPLQFSKAVVSVRDAASKGHTSGSGEVAVRSELGRGVATAGVRRWLAGIFVNGRLSKGIPPRKEVTVKSTF